MYDTKTSNGYLAGIAVGIVVVVADIVVVVADIVVAGDNLAIVGIVGDGCYVINCYCCGYYFDKAKTKVEAERFWSVLLDRY